MEIFTKSLLNYTVIKINGRIDSYATPMVQDALETLLRNSKCNIVIDMQDVFYLSSSGLLVFLETQRIINRQGQGALVFANMSPEVYSIIEIAGLENVFAFCSDMQSAEGRFQK